MLYWNRNHSVMASALVILVLLTGILLYSGWLAPLKEERSSLMNRVEAKEDAVELLRGEKRENSISKEESKQLQNILPIDEQEDQFLLMLERAEAASRTSIQSITRAGEMEIDESVEQPGIGTLIYDLEMASDSFGDLMRFLQNHEEMKRFTVIESITFDSASAEPESGELLYYFVRVTTYHYPSLDALEPEAPGYDFGEAPGKVTPFETD